MDVLCVADSVQIGPDHLETRVGAKFGDEPVSSEPMQVSGHRPVDRRPGRPFCWKYWSTPTRSSIPGRKLKLGYQRRYEALESHLARHDRDLMR